MRKYQSLMASTAIIAGLVSVSPASAQSVTLTPGAPSTTPAGSTGPDYTYDAVTGVQTATSTATDAVSVDSTYSSSAAVWGFGGQVVTQDINAAASTSYNETTTTVVTSTPDGSGGFTVSAPAVTGPVQTSPTAVSNVALYSNASTAITGLGSESSYTTSSYGDTATYDYNLGLVSTDGIMFVNGTGTATYDPATGQINDNGLSSAPSVTELDAAGLSTTGSVDAANVNVTSTLNLNGNTISNVGTGVLATDAANTGQVTAEATARAAAVSAEAATRAANDTTLQNNITAEATARAAADTTLTTNLAAEVTARTASVSAEATARAAADATLTTNLAAEATARTAADTTLTTNLAAEVSARTAAVASEASARAAADNALGVRIDSEAAARVAGDAQLRNEIASSTAAAIALGGNAILPDKSFTLSGNVGFYQGASAIAVNAAARISPNVYVTGAVGGGLNKSGKLGGRVGVVFGF